ncbi:hypothetical protein G647_07001 [Cladophialophora carrionii CBS 160.54]|uniref:Uncharacterized protein n=1 Tax=Cladophialophora carrionii CBS 160.54 TaxID=1279043 RepID=V9D147_9EURO|nr:uncharacterized protein G647_07001 [Cladophialophora carrionii CBS 160.54]ETI20659.1 hypothetical protein G647_07001 [Cladophialophora carrionii CBS 160.54]
MAEKEHIDTSGHGTRRPSGHTPPTAHIAPVAEHAPLAEHHAPLRTEHEAAPLAEHRAPPLVEHHAALRAEHEAAPLVEHSIAAPAPRRPPIPPPEGPGFRYPPEGYDPPGPGEIFHASGASKRDESYTSMPTSRTPPPSSIYGNLKPHSGGAGKAGYPFFGSGYADVPGMPNLTEEKKLAAGIATPRPALATGPAVAPPGGHREIRGPAGDFHGAPTRHFNPEEHMLPPVYNRFKTLKDEGKQNIVNNSLRHATGPLRVGSSGIGASTGELPITTTDGFHTSRDPHGDHVTFAVDPAINTDGTTHLYHTGSSSSVGPPGPDGDRPVHEFFNDEDFPLPPVVGLPHPFPLRLVEDATPTAGVPYYPDPDKAAAAAERLGS